MSGDMIVSYEELERKIAVGLMELEKQRLSASSTTAAAAAPGAREAEDKGRGELYTSVMNYLMILMPEVDSDDLKAIRKISSAAGQCAAACMTPENQKEAFAMIRDLMTVRVESGSIKGIYKILADSSLEGTNELAELVKGNIQSKRATSKRR